MAQAIKLVARAQTQLYEQTGAHWSANELLDALNEALGAAFEANPDLFVVTETRKLAAGARQTLPAPGSQFRRVVSAAGRSVTPFDPAALDAVMPGWRNEPAGAVRQYAPDADATAFWVYPPQPDPPGEAEVEYLADPPTLAFGDTLPVDRRFDRPLLDYMLFRAYSKDTEYAGQDGRALMHHTMFTQGLFGGGDS